MHDPTNNDPPYCVIMKDFLQHKMDARAWHSPPFYSSPNGYKMQLRVDANGNANGRRTHVSVYVYLLEGEHDNKLSWPYKGSIDIQFINWKDDSNLAKTVCFNDSSARASTNGERPREGEKSKGWGYHQFLPHGELCSTNAKYIQDDTLYLIVSNITV